MTTPGQNDLPEPGSSITAQIIEHLVSLRPKYGAVGSRDVEVALQSRKIDHAIAAIQELEQTLDGLRAQVAEQAAATAAYKWGYGYLQSRMESLDRHGWAHDCDGEIEARISDGKAQQAPAQSAECRPGG